MGNSAMSRVPPSAIVMAGSALAMCFVFVFWNMWLRTNVDVESLTSWSDVSWQLAQVDERGRLVRLGSHPFALASLFGLVAICSVIFAIGAWQWISGIEARRTAQQKELSGRIDLAGQQLEDELGALFKVLRDHIEVSGKHSNELVRANRVLPTLTTVEQVRSVVHALINENTKVQNEVASLNVRLQHSQSQITNLRSNLTESQKLGMHDALTQLKNRHWMQANFAKEVKAAADADMPLSLIMADIDHFKRINDTFGHAVGDEIIKRFGELLSKNIKGRDTAVRYGGEEFLVVLPNTKLDGAAYLGEQIRTELDTKRWMHHKTGQPIGKVTASFGVAQLRSGEKPEALVDRADTYLYEAKTSGRNRIVSET